MATYVIDQPHLPIHVRRINSHYITPILCLYKYLLEQIVIIRITSMELSMHIFLRQHLNLIEYALSLNFASFKAFPHHTVVLRNAR